MESDHQVPLIRSSSEFSHLTRTKHSESPSRINSLSFQQNPTKLYNSERLQQFRASTEEILTSNCKTTKEIIKELSSAIQEDFPTVINSPYSFSDVKIMLNETHALAVTNEGYSVYVDIINNTFEESLLSQNSLSTVLLCKEDKIAFVKEKDFGKIFCLELPTMKIITTLKTLGEGANGIGRMFISPDENYLYARL